MFFQKKILAKANDKPAYLPGLKPGNLRRVIKILSSGYVTPLQKGVFFSCIFPLRKLTEIIIYLTDRYFGFLCDFIPVLWLSFFVF